MLIGAARLWSGGHFREEIGIEIVDGAVRSVEPLGGARPDIAAAVALPAPTDLQVNGGGGVLINAEPTVEEMRRVAAAHRARGTGWIMATVITDAPEVAERAATAVREIAGRDGVLGLHLEGPHIAPARRGTHEARYIRRLDRRTVDLVGALSADGIPVMVTLAPERADPDLLAELVATGAVVSAGHSEATAAEAEAAFAAGVKCATHLFNAMPPMLSRAPGLVGAVLASRVPAGIIADGVHVEWTTLRVALAARPDGLFLVSDAMPSVGGPDRFTLYGKEVTVRGGALINAEGALAGAHLDMTTALRNVVRHGGVTLERAVAMATDTPRRLMGLAVQDVEPGMAAEELLLLDADLMRISPVRKG